MRLAYELDEGVEKRIPTWGFLYRKVLIVGTRIA